MSDITPESLLDAYASGIFPMAPDRDSDELNWYFPEERGILPLDGMVVPRKLMRTIRSGKFQVTADRAFGDVMLACAEPSPGREETWISPRICALYGVLHQRNHAHSIEVWDGERLVGGLYGVALGGVFSGKACSPVSGMFPRLRWSISLQDCVREAIAFWIRSTPHLI